MYKLCVYVDKLDSVEITVPDIELLSEPKKPNSLDFFDCSPKYGAHLLWPRIFELNPDILLSTMVCNYSLCRALDLVNKKSEKIPQFAPAKKSLILFLLAVPNDFTLLELAEWLGTATKKIKAIKMIVLNECLGFYSMLLYFDTLKNSEEIYEVFLLVKSHKNIVL